MDLACAEVHDGRAADVALLVDRADRRCSAAAFAGIGKDCVVPGAPGAGAPASGSAPAKLALVIGPFDCTTS